MREREMFSRERCSEEDDWDHIVVFFEERMALVFGLGDCVMQGGGGGGCRDGSDCRQRRQANNLGNVNVYCEMLESFLVEE